MRRARRFAYLAAGTVLAVLLSLPFVSRQPEIQGFGFNQLTLSFLAVIAFALWGAWGLIDQAFLIWNYKSGKSVSVTAFSVPVFLYAAYYFYGIQENNIAMLFFGSIRIEFLVPIVLGLWKYKGFTKAEKATFLAMSFFMALNILIPYKNYFYIGFSYAGVLAMLKQPWEMIQERDTGKMSIRLFSIYTASGAFWTWYGFKIHDTNIKIVSMSVVAVGITVIALWFKYRENPR